MIYEWRIYHIAPGKDGALHRRFADHTCRLFARHGMQTVGFWTRPEEPDRLYYMLAFPDRAARDRSWAAFQADPEWQRVKAESEAGGRLVERIESLLCEPTPYSPLR